MTAKPSQTSTPSLHQIYSQSEREMRITAKRTSLDHSSLFNSHQVLQGDAKHTFSKPANNHEVRKIPTQVSNELKIGKVIKHKTEQDEDDTIIDIEDFKSTPKTVDQTNRKQFENKGAKELSMAKLVQMETAKRLNDLKSKLILQRKLNSYEQSQVHTSSKLAAQNSKQQSKPFKEKTETFNKVSDKQSSVPNPQAKASQYAVNPLPRPDLQSKRESRQHASPNIKDRSFEDLRKASRSSRSSVRLQRSSSKDLDVDVIEAMRNLKDIQANLTSVSFFAQKNTSEDVIAKQQKPLGQKANDFGSKPTKSKNSAVTKNEKGMASQRVPQISQKSTVKNQPRKQSKNSGEICQGQPKLSEQQIMTNITPQPQKWENTANSQAQKSLQAKNNMPAKNQFLASFNGSRFLHEINLNLAIVEETLSMISKIQPVCDISERVAEPLRVSSVGLRKLSASKNSRKSLECSEHYFVSLSNKGTPESSHSQDPEEANKEDTVPAPFASSPQQQSHVDLGKIDISSDGEILGL